MEYHDNKWCKPQHNDNEIFATLCLEIFAAGLSWRIILEKEIPFRNVFDNFNPNIVTLYSENKIKDLMNNRNIVRNIKKIKATIKNDNVFINIQKEFGSFYNYIWKFTNNKVIDNHLRNGNP